MSADHLASKVPFAFEEAVVARYSDLLPDPHPSSEYLQSLAESLASAMELPQDMKVTVHYVPNEEFNAFATLGGHIVVMGGLASELPHENALAMLLAHEIAHLKYRHPIRSLGRGVVVMLALATFVGAAGNDFALKVLGDASGLTLLTFSRAQEHEADVGALPAVYELYGHTNGALDLYETFVERLEEEDEEAFEFFSTHPLTRERIADLEQLAADNSWSVEGELTPLGQRFEH